VLLYKNPPGTKPRMAAPSRVGNNMVWTSCTSSGSGSSIAPAAAAALPLATDVAALPSAAAACIMGDAAKTCGRMKGMVNMPRMLEVTVSNSARETLPPSCYSQAGQRQKKQNSNVVKPVVRLT
jgi:hypothetical protein